MTVPDVPPSTTETQQVTIAADFGRPVDYPLVKTKFGVFNSGIVPLAQYERDVAVFSEVRPESLRIDLGWGAPWAGWVRQPIHGTIDKLSYDWSEVDALARFLNRHGILPYWSYCYQFVPLQSPPGEWRSAPADAQAWGQILGDAARHFRETQPLITIGYHEIYNEPDNDFFFTGSFDDYVGMYRSGTTAIRTADPDAPIGGPGLAWEEQWIAPFLEFVSQEQLPLDFFSFHFYGTEQYLRHDLPTLLRIVREHFAGHPQFATTELHLNEFNSYPIEYPQGGVQDKYPLAAALLRDLSYLLEQPDITLVHWAQFLDSGQGNYSGMVSIDGHRKAVFNAFHIYGRMPVDRCDVTINGSEGIKALASYDTHMAALVVWNQSPHNQTVTVALHNIPFPYGDLRIYRIDGKHGSWGDDPATEFFVPIESVLRTEMVGVMWSGEVPAGGVVYLEADDGTRHTGLAPSPVAEVVRVLRYYPDRSTTAYADFDKHTWIARLGMAQEQTANLHVGVTADRVPDVLHVAMHIDGTLERIDENSLLGLRIDYDEQGVYTKSVLMHGPYLGGIDLFDAQRTARMPWGTQRQADEVVHAPDLSTFQIDVAAHAPPGWNGRVQLTVIMQNAGIGSRAKVSIRAANS